MNRPTTLLLLLSLAATLVAKPARRVATHLAQPDGTRIEAIFDGDEHLSFYVTPQGRRLERGEDGWWREMTDDEVTAQNVAWNERRRLRQAATAATAGVPSRGEHRLLALLVEFPDLRFSELGTTAHFEAMLNGDNYTTAATYSADGKTIVKTGDAGSARQYFIDQSLGAYSPTFDIVGPIMVSHDYAFYGRKVGSTNDQYADSMVAEAARIALTTGLIDDLSPYDNDNNTLVDMVYVFYAGYSQAEHAGDDYIWPHQGHINHVVSKNGRRIYTYACSSELQGTPSDSTLVVDGIGSCVHEFGHALGLPDFYNTGSQRGCYGMDCWDVMDVGCYNGDGRVPPSYTAHERLFLGWTELTELPTEGTVTLPPFATSNQAYIIRNPANSNEYYTLENHQCAGWDLYWGGYSLTGKHGMLITHVDYSSSAWSSNRVNTSPSHQRCTPVPADGDLWAYDKIASMTSEQRQDWYNSYRADIFPGRDKVTSCDFTASPFFSGEPIDLHIDNIEEAVGGNITFTVGSSVDGLRTLHAEPRHAPMLFDLTGRNIATPSTAVRHGIYIERRADGTARIVRQ